MSAARIRFLRPTLLALLPSGLWAVDGFHPVAAVLDPDTGAVRRVVSWSQVPAAAWDTGGELPLVHSDGTGLWVQHDRLGPLVRVDEDGLGVAVWTDDVELEACGPGVAWCVARPLAVEPQEMDDYWHDQGRLLRVDREGHTTRLKFHGRIEQARALPDGVLLKVVTPHIGGRGLEVTTEPGWVNLRWADDVPDELIDENGWVHLPWDGAAPGELTPVGRGVPGGTEPDWDAWGKTDWDDVGRRGHRWHGAPYLPYDVITARHRWCLGWVQESPRRPHDRRPLLATAHTPDGVEVGRWDLGGGSILSTIPLGDRLAVAVGRAGGASEVLALHPDNDEVAVLLGTDTIDITELGWPMVTHPVAAESYASEVHARLSRLQFSAEELSHVDTALNDDWPDTVLEWSFRSTARPDLLLRRRVPLFDDLGRIAYPENAETYLVETVDSDGVPPAGDAVDGVLDL